MGSNTPNWDLCKSQIPIFPRLFGKTPHQFKYPHWDLCKSRIPIFPRLFGKTPNRVKYPHCDLCKCWIPIFPRLFGKTPNQARLPPIEICVNPESQFFPNYLERLQIGSDYPPLRTKNRPDLESFQIVREKLGFGIYTNLNGGIWPDVEFFQIVKKKLAFEIYTNLNWGYLTRFRVFPNSRGKIGIRDLPKSQLGVVWPDL